MMSHDKTPTSRNIFGDVTLNDPTADSPLRVVAGTGHLFAAEALEPKTAALPLARRPGHASAYHHVGRCCGRG